MKEQLILILVICVFIGLIAATLTAVVKVLFFIRKDYAFTRIFKAALIGELAGIILLILLESFYGKIIAESPDPANIWGIPVVFMIMGLITGTIINWKSRKQ